MIGLCAEVGWDGLGEGAVLRIWVCDGIDVWWCTFGITVSNSSFVMYFAA